MRCSCQAAAAPVEDQDVGGLGPALGRKQLTQIGLDPLRRAGLRPAESPRNAPNMGIDHHPRDAKGITKDHVRRLAPDPGQSDQLRHALRHLTGVTGEQRCGTADQVSGLVVIKTGRADQLFHFVLSGKRQTGRRGESAEQLWCHQVHPDISTLGREDGCCQQLPGTFMVESTVGFGINCSETLERCQRE